MEASRSSRTQPPSPIALLLSLPDDERNYALEKATESDRRQLTELLDSWEHCWTRPVEYGGARDSQLAPDGEWFIWICKAGRGFGKTRLGAEYVRSRTDAGDWRTVNIVGPTAADVRDVMVEGASGLLHIWPEHERPEYVPSKRQIRTHNGATIYLLSADEPERFRGPQCDGAWADEIDCWKPKGMPLDEAWTLFELGVRLGEDPRIIATSTPKRARLISKLLERPDTVVTSGSTYENRANLAPSFFRSIVSQYEGTRIGRQEIAGEILDDVEGAIVSHSMIDASRVAAPPEMRRVVVGVDPSGGSNAQGIVAVGHGIDGHAYVLADRTCTLSPDGWGRRVIELYRELKADRVIAERNYGGDMVESTLRTVDPTLSLKLVTASRGKHVRFEPVGALYEQGRVHHVGAFPELEEEVCAFTPDGYEGDDSPNRADALVWAVSELMFHTGPSIDDCIDLMERANVAA